MTSIRKEIQARIPNLNARNLGCFMLIAELKLILVSCFN